MEKINERGCDRPTIRHLIKHVVPLVATVWYDLGIQLLLQPNEQTTIVLNAKNNPNMCCTQMFEKWLIMDQMASWNKLIRAVKDIQMHSAAAAIEDMLIQDEKKSNEHSITQASLQKHKENQQKDKNLDRLLKNAVENGKIVEFLHIKIFLTGSSAAGKTSLRNSLFNENFEKEHKPTRLQETKHAYVASILESADGDVEWLVLTPEQQISHFKRLLETERPKNKANKESDVQSDISESIDIEPLKDLGEQLHNSKGLAPRLKIPDPANLITIVDTGGQPEFIHMLPAIVNCPTINFVVIDMTKKLTDKVEVYDKDKKQENKVTVEVYCDQEEKIKEEDEVEVVHYKVKEDQVNKMQVSKDEVNVKVHYKVKEEDEVKKENSMEVCIHYKSKKSMYSLDYTYEELIKLLMSITSNTKASGSHDDAETCASISKQSGVVSLIGFVGTHKDKVDTEARDKLTKQLNKLVDEQDCTSLSVLMNGDDYLFQVDNTKSGSGKKDTEVVKIRKEIEKVIKRHINVYPVPITWMILEIRIKSLYESKHFITFDKFSKVADKEVSIKSKEDVESVLRYFNQLGIFLYFVEVPKMKHYVIIDHQWFYSKICSLMGLSPDNLSINDRTSKKRFKQGLLLKNDLLNLKLDEEMETESLVELLCHMKIIACYKENSEHLYYIPHILPYCSYYQDRYKYLILEPLLVRFSSGFLPRGFFCSLVVHLLQKPPCEHTQWRKIDFDQNYRNVITFYVNEEFYLRLQDKVYYLEIQVRNNKYCKRRCMAREFKEIRNYLYQACENLKLDYEKLEYGFMCCDDHMVTVPLHSTTNVYCKKCQEPYEMGPLHKLWFEEKDESDLDASVKKDFGCSSTEGKKCSFYPDISTQTPILSVVINNKNFQGCYTNKPRGEGSDKDYEKLMDLEKFGFVFDDMHFKDCTANEMKAIMKIIVDSDKILEVLQHRHADMKNVVSRLKNKHQQTMELLGPDHRNTFNCLFQDNRPEFEKMVSTVLQKPLSEYYGVCVFIMTHGEENDNLIGSDGESVTLTEIASYFNAQNCKALLNKPKIFVVQACRGSKYDKCTDDISHAKGSTVTPMEADFLFAFATPKSYDCYLRDYGSPFIQTFVDTLSKKLHQQHLQDILLSVKTQVAEEVISSDGKQYKQIPSVVSQMRDKIWFKIMKN